MKEYVSRILQRVTRNSAVGLDRQVVHGSTSEYEYENSRARRIVDKSPAREGLEWSRSAIDDRSVAIIAGPSEDRALTESRTTKERKKLRMAHPPETDVRRLRSTKSPLPSLLCAALYRRAAWRCARVGPVILYDGIIGSLRACRTLSSILVPMRRCTNHQNEENN